MRYERSADHKWVKVPLQVRLRRLDLWKIFYFPGLIVLSLLLLMVLFSIIELCKSDHSLHWPTNMLLWIEGVPSHPKDDLLFFGPLLFGWALSLVDPLNAKTFSLDDMLLQRLDVLEHNDLAIRKRVFPEDFDPALRKSLSQLLKEAESNDQQIT